MRTLFACITLGIAGCQCAKKPDKPVSTDEQRGPNLVFVSFDALQASHVGCYGYPRPTTPTIDAMAKSGYRFENAISVSSWTVPSSMTWFTGVYPSEHRMVNKFSEYNAKVQRLANLKELSPKMTTLADVLRDNGYATAAFTGNAGVSAGFGFEQGFDVYFQEPARFGKFDRSIPEAIAWLKENKDRKFFLFLHGYDVHGQSSPAGGYDRRFVDNNYDGKYIGSELEQEALREEGLERGQLTLRDADVQFWRGIYDEKIQRADAKFAQFLEEITRLGLMDNTLFVLTSDHGTELYEHRRFDHGFTLYQELVHVPLIVKLPGQSEGKTIPARVSSIDVMPTVLDLLAVPLSETARLQMRGSSLRPAMEGKPAARDVFSETDYREYTFKRSVTTPDGWKYIHTLESKTRELYDLNTDPGERTKLIAKEPNRAADLEQRLFAHFKSIGHDLTARRWQTGMNPVYNTQGKK